MSNILEKKGDNITKAITYVDEHLKANKDKKLQTLISEAGARFNLTPKDVEYLSRVFKDRG